MWKTDVMKCAGCNKPHLALVTPREDVPDRTANGWYECPETGDTVPILINTAWTKLEDEEPPEDAVEVRFA